MKITMDKRSFSRNKTYNKVAYILVVVSLGLVLYGLTIESTYLPDTIHTEQRQLYIRPWSNPIYLTKIDAKKFDLSIFTGILVFLSTLGWGTLLSWKENKK